MNWIVFAILAASSFGFYNFFMKLTADKLSPTIALMFIAGTSFLVALITTLIFKLLIHNPHIPSDLPSSIFHLPIVNLPSPS